jgi:hypothetical protein|tara:strand:- start:220 stop:1422 length:1203 start_codon:yes stop_codon:yes gene_type:complete
MLAKDEMTIDERRKYLKRMRERYWAADRAGRGELLTEMEAVTGLHRKSLIRLVRAPTLERKRSHRKRGRAYGPEVEDAIRVVWESLDYVCAERLTPVLVQTARHLERFGELVLTADLEAQLARVSRATVQRRMRKLSQDTPRLPRRGPERANRLTQAVPMGRLPWETTEPGHFEVDLVHHCGPVAAGEYIHTLQLVDVATGWSERVAVLGRNHEAMKAGFRRVLKRLPFPVLQLHPDNGSEFFNDHMIRFWGEHIVGLKLSRSRPYRKNDNRIVEQKNDTLVRAYLGYERMDTAAQCSALNALYDRMWTYYNLFQPVLHLRRKTAVNGRLRRQWDKAQTPYDRLVDSGVLDPHQHAQLAATHLETNPRRLRQRIYQELVQMREQPTLERKEHQLIEALAS